MSLNTLQNIFEEDKENKSKSSVSLPKNTNKSQFSSLESIFSDENKQNIPKVEMVAPVKEKTRLGKAIESVGNFFSNWNKKAQESEFALRELTYGKTEIKKDPTTGKVLITSPRLEAFNQAKTQEEKANVLKESEKDTPLIKLLNTKTSKKVLEGFVDQTSDLPLKGIAKIKSLGDQSYEEALAGLMEWRNNPDKPYYQKVIADAQSSIVQSGIGVLLGLATRNKAVPTAYFSAISAGSQVKEKGEVYSLENIAIDTLGDTIISGFAEGVLKNIIKDGTKFTVKELSKNAVKGFLVEGFTEPTQSVLKYANDYKNAKSESERDDVLADMVEYVKSGEILHEALVGGISGAVITGAVYTGGSLMNKKKDTKEEDTEQGEFKLEINEEAFKEIFNEKTQIEEALREDPTNEVAIKRLSEIEDNLMDFQEAFKTTNIFVPNKNPELEPYAKIETIKYPNGEYGVSVLVNLQDYTTLIPFSTENTFKTQNDAILSGNKEVLNFIEQREELFTPEEVMAVEEVKKSISKDIPYDLNKSIPFEITDKAILENLMEKAKQFNTPEEFKNSLSEKEYMALSNFYTPIKDNGFKETRDIKDFWNKNNKEKAKKIKQEKKKAKKEVDYKKIDKLEKELKDAYSQYPDAPQVMEEILASLELAEAGRREIIGYGIDQEVIGISSSFPAWIPENVRSRKALDKLLEIIKDIQTISFDKKPNATARRLLVNEMLAELDFRLGIDTSSIRADILKEYGQQEDTKVNDTSNRGGDQERTGRGEATQRRKELESKKEKIDEDSPSVLSQKADKLRQELETETNEEVKKQKEEQIKELQDRIDLLENFQTIDPNEFIPTEQAIKEALKIPIFKELSNQGKTLLVERLNNPNALGSYYQGVIRFLKNPDRTTLPHEAFHSFADLILSQEEKQNALNLVKKDGMTNIQAEEILAQEFAEWYVAQQKQTPLQRIFEKIKTFFEKLLKLEKPLTQLFKQVLDPNLIKRINTFKENGGIEELRVEFNQDPAIFSYELFKDPLWKNETTKRATIISALGRLKKPLMRQIVQNKLDTDFVNQDIIDTKELQRAIYSDLIQFSIIDKKTSYDDYGLENINRRELEREKAGTVILNTNFKHGKLGHFASQFDFTTTKEDLEIRKIDAGTYDVEGGTQRVDKTQYYVARKNLQRDNIEEGVFGKFDTEEQAQEYINNFSDRVVREAGMFGHFRFFIADDVFYVSEMQSDVFQKDLSPLARTNKRLLDSEISELKEKIKEQETMLKTLEDRKKDLSNREFDIKEKAIKEEIGELNKKIKEKEDDFASKKEGLYFAREVRSKIIDTQMAWQSIVKYTQELKKDLSKNPENMADWLSADLRKLEINAGIKIDYNTTFVDEITYEQIRKTDIEDESAIFNKFLFDNNTEIGNRNRKILLEKLNQIIKKHKKQYEEYISQETDKLSPEQQRELMLSEQYLAFKNNYYETIINTAIRKASMEGANFVRFPSPYVVAKVEGYIQATDDENFMSYNEGDYKSFRISDIGNRAQENIASKYGIDENGNKGAFYKYLEKKRKDLSETVDEYNYNWYETRILPEDKASVELFQTKDQITKKGGEEYINQSIKKEIKPKKKTIKTNINVGSLGFNPRNLIEPSSKKAQEETNKIVKRSEIAKELSDKFGVPIRRGRFNHRGAIGLYKSGPKVVRYKAGGLPTIFHEIGHFLDDKFGFSYDIPKNERIPLMSEYGFTYAGQPNTQRMEAFAEFLRYKMTGQEDKIKNFAPEYNKIWQAKMEAMPEIKEVIETAIGDYQRWLSQPAEAKILSQISFEEKEKINFTNKFHTLYQNTIDDLHPLDQFTELGKKVLQGNIPAEKNPYMLARNLRGWVGKANTFLQKGTFGRDFYIEKDGQIVANFKGKGLQEILLPIERAGMLDKFRIYLIAKRSIELGERQIKTGIDINDARLVVENTERTNPEFIEKANEVYKYQDDLLKYALDSGLLGQEGYLKIKELNKARVPFYRVMEEVSGKYMGGKKIGGVKSPIKKIKGSDREIIDPLESIVKDTYAIINASERNNVGMALVRLAGRDFELGRLVEKVPLPMQGVKVNVEEVLEKAGILKEELPEGAIDELVSIFRPSQVVGNNTIIVNLGDKKVAYELDSDLYKAIQGINDEEISYFIQLISIPAKLLRSGATLTPDFVIKNPMRDQFSAFVNSKFGYKPFYDMVRGMFELFKKGDTYDLWRMAGGEQASLVSLDRTSLKENIKDLLATKGQTALKYVKNPIELLRIASEIAEQATRLGEMKRALNKKASPVEGAFASRELTLDFARMGAKTKALNMITAFWNANVQDTDKLIRTFKANPRKTSFRVFLAITLPSILLYYANRDDERWKEIPQWQKDIFWIIITEKNIYRIPKPFLTGTLFGSMPERILEYMDTKDKTLFKKMAKSVMDGATPSFLPTGLIPLIENITNYSFFKDRPIVSRGKEDLPPKYQTSNYTSEVAKIIGETFNISPDKVDNLLFGYTGGLGRYGTNILDYIFKKTGIREDQVKPAKELAEKPVIKSFMVKTPYGSSSESVNRIYSEYKSISSKYKYFNQMAENRNISEEKLDKYLEKYPEIAYYTYVNSLIKEFSAIREAKDLIYEDDTMTSITKKKYLLELDQLQTQIAQEGLEVLKEK